ncbi:hypothetical protein [Erwinia sp. S38]|uniref:hypothetical protein n=1 Tax=Erwinia sp. S38 TaxID=2769338 RepID=UPI00190C5E3A|nr:hypothetical protein [Erwinia sp. S38]MBK0000451.1 hypothetical protein [Erwinia sp. S38]
MRQTIGCFHGEKPKASLIQLSAGDTRIKAQTGGSRDRAIHSAERSKEARIHPHGRGGKPQPGQDGPSVAVRQADARSEGTAARREDRPTAGPAGQRDPRSTSEPATQQPSNPATDYYP